MTDRKRALHDLGPGMESAWSPIPKRGVQPRTGGSLARCPSPSAQAARVTFEMDAERLRRFLGQKPKRVDFDVTRRSDDE